MSVWRLSALRAPLFSTHQRDAASGQTRTDGDHRFGRVPRDGRVLQETASVDKCVCRCRAGTDLIHRGQSTAPTRSAGAVGPAGTARLRLLTACYDDAVVVSHRRWLAVFVLIGWVLLGPIGMAFDSCAAMMALCDGGPCGVVSAVSTASPSLAPPTALTTVPAPAPEHFVAVHRPALKPPPKPIHLSA